MADYLGDFVTGKTIHHKFMTVNSSGAPTTLGNSPTCILYVNGSVSGVASGLTLTADFDGRTGLNHVQFLATTSVTGVTSGTEFQIVVATGSVSGVSLNGYPICDFSLMNRSALMPATAGRTLVVNSSGSTAIDWGQVSNPSTTVALSATTLFTTTNVTNVVGASVTASSINIGAIVTACNTVVPANVTAYSTAIAANVTAVSTVVPANVTASSINIGAVVTACNTVVPANVTASSINIGAIVTACNTVVPANVTAYSTVIAANVTAISTVVPARVTAMASGTITSDVFSTSAIDSNAIATTAAAEIAGAVWDVTLASHVGAGSTGEALNAAGAAGDPWITALPGAYGAGSAGFILGTNLDAKSSDIKAKTDKLTFNASNAASANITFVNSDQVKGAGTAADPWVPV